MHKIYKFSEIINSSSIYSVLYKESHTHLSLQEMSLTIQYVDVFYAG